MSSATWNSRRAFVLSIAEIDYCLPQFDSICPVEFESMGRLACIVWPLHRRTLYTSSFRTLYPMSDDNIKRIPPFIDDQVVFRLTAPASERHKWLGQKFTWRRTFDTKLSDPQSGNETHTARLSDVAYLESKSIWLEVPERWALFSDPAVRLLCIVDDAGMGKSISIGQIQYARQLHDSSHLAIHCEFHELPHDWRGYFGHHPGTGTQEFLLSRLMHGCGAKVDRASDIAALKQLLNAKLCQGQLTLLVDALDQSNRHEHSEEAASALAAFIKSEPRLRCVVSGRPFAIAHYWETLFSRCGSRSQDQWELVQLAEFTQDQAYKFVGEERAARLKLVQAEVLAIPRDLETILELEPEELDDVRNSADIYWKCFDRTLAKAMRDQQFRIKAPTAQKLFALLAFETVMRGLYAAVGEEKKGLQGEDFQEFADQLFESRKEQLGRDLSGGESLDNMLGTLGALNIVIDPGILSVESDANPNNPALRQLYFRNRTLQDFLAALWLVRYSTPADRGWLKQRKYVQGDSDKSQENADLYQLWNFVCEMPAVAQTSGRTGFVDLATSLLLPSDHPEFTVRSTEMIWRCWPGMLQAAGSLTSKQRYEKDMEPITRALQREARHIVESGETLPIVGGSAKSSLLQFLGEYHRIRLHQHRRFGTKEARTANAFESGFRLCPPESHDSLESWFGNGGFWSSSDSSDNPIVISIANRFQMHQTPLTNSEYRLFDASHETRFSDYRSYSGKAGCPVIYLNWHDAWAVCTWLNGQLPSEFEWEYACRASPGATAARTEFCFGNEQERLTDFAWHFENSVGETHEVLPARKAQRKESNAWGLFHMHGNVWEWCSNWWADTAEDSVAPEYASSSRCLRGGSFYRNPEYCRSARRSRNDPTFSNNFIGVRLSRAASD